MESQQKHHAVLGMETSRSSPLHLASGWTVC